MKPLDKMKSHLPRLLGDQTFPAALQLALFPQRVTSAPEPIGFFPLSHLIGVSILQSFNLWGQKSNFLFIVKGAESGSVENVLFPLKSRVKEQLSVPRIRKEVREGQRQAICLLAWAWEGTPVHKPAPANSSVKGKQVRQVRVYWEWMSGCICNLGQPGVLSSGQPWEAIWTQVRAGALQDLEGQGWSEQKLGLGSQRQKRREPSVLPRWWGNLSRVRLSSTQRISLLHNTFFFWYWDRTQGCLNTDPHLQPLSFFYFYFFLNEMLHVFVTNVLLPSTEQLSPN